MSTVLVFEQKPRWVPELQRQFAGKEVRIRRCGELSEVEQHLVQKPNSVVLLELADDPAACWHFLTRLMGITPAPKTLVMASSAFKNLEWITRELGAVTFWEEPIPSQEMTAWCKRQFDLQSEFPKS